MPLACSKIVTALGHLLDANVAADAVLPGPQPDGVVLTMSGLFHLNGRSDWQDRAARLLDLLLVGLHAGAPAGADHG